MFTGDETIKDYNKQQSRSHRVNNIMIHKDYETASKKNNIGMACFPFQKISFFERFLKYCSFFLSLRDKNVGSWLILSQFYSVKPETYLESSKTSKIEPFGIIVKGFQPLTIGV